MAGIIESFKQGLRGSDHVSVAGVRARCPHCGGEDFEVGEALLNTPGMTFMKLDWANRSATVLTCLKCGHVDWFLNDAEAVD